ncbi:MAG: PAS domain-containing protein [Alphaproteobacteria bacterium]|nr:MAG: PAS domain-containing protein [Alphaproteobacteria bacterium]
MRSLKEQQKIVPLKRTAAPDVKAMLHALPDAVLALDAEGRVIFSNDAAQAFFGLGEKGLVGKPAAGLMGDATPAQDILNNKLQTVTAHDIVVCGKPVSSLSIVPMVEEGFSLLVLRQEPLPVKSEWVARVKRTLKPAQHLARMLAHEIKNPLSGIRGAAQLLAKSDLSPDDHELATLIDNEAQRIFRLIDKVNIFDDAPHHQYRALNIHEALAQVVRLAESGFGVKIAEQYDPSLPEIYGHPDRIMQALLNIVKNAAEALPSQGGRIIIRTYYDTAAAMHPESRAKLPVCIDVEDNGSGIGTEMQRRLFEPYNTTKPQGEGLGLSIVSKIIDDHGGAVDVTSIPGRTVFKISFPRSDKS